MKILHEEIEGCQNCPYRTYDEMDSAEYCDKDLECRPLEFVKLEDPTYTPDWCPLPEKTS